MLEDSGIGDSGEAEALRGEIARLSTANAQAQATIAELTVAREAAEAEAARHAAADAEAQAEIARLTGILEAFQRHRFGARSDPLRDHTLGRADPLPQ